MTNPVYNKADVRDWLAKAHDDIRFGESSISGGFYPQVCFISQQVAEKALKALIYARQDDFIPAQLKRIKMHHLGRLLRFLHGLGVDIPEEVAHSCETVDRYYLPTRYPDVPAPVNTYTEDIAQDAMAHAKVVVQFVEHELGEF